MVRLKILLGENAVGRYDENSWKCKNLDGRIRLAKKLATDEGIFIERKFKTEEESNAYLEGMRDCCGWLDYIVIA